MSADDALACAEHYHSLGWCPLPVPIREKGPVLFGWPEIRLTAAELPRYFSCRANIGLHLLPPLVDIDLDCPEAIAFADDFLPATWTFGRATAERSHRLYLSAGAKFWKASAQKTYAVLKHGTLSTTLLELRTGAGKQTVVPPSVHCETGERIAWSPDDCDASEAPTEIAPRALRTRCAKLAAVALVARICGDEAARNWLASGDCPELPNEAAELVRDWWGLKPAPQVAARPRCTSTSNVLERVRRYLSKVPPAISGCGGHAHTFLLAQRLVRGFELDDDQALTLLREWNTTCQPPWSERELAHKVREARERGTAVRVGQHLGGRP